MNQELSIPSMRPRAFSLVEVAMAMGIASFCLLAVVGLLPVGLDAARESREESGAARCLEQIAQSLRSAERTSGGFRASGAFTNLEWAPATGLASTMTNLSLEGPDSEPAEQRLVARVEIAPQNGGPVCQALVTVAWPNRVTWEASTSSWKNAQGSLSTWVIFRSPR